MKKLLFPLFFICLLFCFCVSVHASGICRVSFADGAYVLNKDGEQIKKYSDISSLVADNIGESLYFDNVRISEQLVITEGEYLFSGRLIFDNGADMRLLGGKVRFYNGEISLVSSSSEIEILGGDLILDSTRISYVSKYAIKLYGTNSANLKIINNTEMIGDGMDVVSEKIISLVDSGEVYTGSDIFKLCYLGTEKSLSAILEYEKNKAPAVVIYTEEGIKTDIYSVSYINEYGRSFSEYRLFGEKVLLPMADEIEGYDFVGWSHNGNIVKEQYISTVANSFSAVYSLNPLAASVNGVCFVYDGSEREVFANEISHPLKENGTIKFSWYRDGRLVSCEEKLKVKNVSDSGDYTLKISFEYGNDSVETEIYGISVDIDPKPLYAVYKDGEFFVDEGEFVEGENPIVNTVKNGNEMYAEINDSNYCLKLSPIILENKVKSKALLWSVLLILFIAPIAYFVFRSAECDDRINALIKRKNSLFSDDEFVKLREGDREVCSRFFSVNKTKADELLTDGMAQNMITKGGRIYTSGSRLVNISLGDLCTNFSPGQKIDINSLKSAGLAEADAYKIKITSEGSIDIPLKIQANEFDSSAIKMIVLAGGEAIKVKSKKIK